MARRFGGEIVSADSRQAYRGLDIGTAKTGPEERASVPHHLIDILDPDEDFGLGPFLDLAAAAIDDITGRDRLPVVVGGSSQYVFALMEGWDVPRIPPNPQLRAELEGRAERDGAEALHAELAAIDSNAASKIAPRNLRRVIRALEVHAAQDGDALRQAQDERETAVNGQSDEALAEEANRVSPANGEPLSAKNGPITRHTLAIGLTLPRPELYRRIDERVDRMIEAGWLAEVEGLLHRGHGPELTSMSSIGYGELAEHVAGKTPLVDAIQRIKNRTHRLARSQYVWLRRADWLQWFDADEAGLNGAMDRVERWALIK